MKNKAFVEEVPDTPSIDLYYKFMKYLTSRMTLVKIVMDSQALNLLQTHNMLIVNE